MPTPPPGTGKYAEGTDAAINFAENLKNLPDVWVACRDMMHAWSVLNDFHVVGKKQGALHPYIRRDLVCMRCNAVRHEEYEKVRSGLDKVYQSYTYPEGYQIPGVPRGVKPKTIVQQEQYRRAMEKVAGAARGETEKAD